MKKLATGKARSVDDVSDMIFKKETWIKLWKKHCNINSKNPEDIEE